MDGITSWHVSYFYLFYFENLGSRVGNFRSLLNFACGRILQEPSAWKSFVWTQLKRREKKFFIRQNSQRRRRKDIDWTFFSAAHSLLFRWKNSINRSGVFISWSSGLMTTVNFKFLTKTRYNDSVSWNYIGKNKWVEPLKLSSKPFSTVLT